MVTDAEAVLELMQRRIRMKAKDLQRELGLSHEEAYGALAQLEACDLVQVVWCEQRNTSRQWEVTALGLVGAPRVLEEASA